MRTFSRSRLSPAWHVALCLALHLFAPAAFAQVAAPASRASDPVGRIRGTVVDGATGDPLGAAAVAIGDTSDPSRTFGTVTGPDGGFLIEGVPAGSYVVEITFVGYSSHTVEDVTVSAENPRVDLGTLRLAPAPVELDELTAAVERSAIRLEADRTTYQVKDLPSAVSGTAIDVLRELPAVDVDVEGNVSLRGGEGVTVQVNGRPVPMRGEQLAAFLRQLPANLIDRVEVMPNPSAKHDPEGAAGVLNIVLRENTDLGTSGGLNLGGGTPNRQNASGNLGYQKGPITLFASYGFFAMDQESEGTLFREYLSSEPRTFLSQRSSIAYDRHSHNLNATGEFRPTGKDIFGISLMLNTWDTDETGIDTYLDLDAGGSATRHFRHLSDRGDDYRFHDHALTYKRTLEGNRHELSVELRHNRTRNGTSNLLAEQPLPLHGGSAPDPAASRREAVDATGVTWTAQADYSRPLGPATRLEIGYKGTLRRLDNDLAASTVAPDGDGLIPDPARSNAFDHDEEIHAGYAVVQRQFGAFEVHGGLRIEHTTTDFELRTTGESHSHGYTDFFPSATLAYRIGETKQLRANYAKRVQRPDSWSLNPFARYQDASYRFVGNPYLEPEYTHAFELGYQQFGSLGSVQISPYYRRSTNALRTIQTVDDEGITTITFRNLATNETWGADVNGSIRFGRLSVFGGVNAYRAETDGSNLEEAVSSRAFTWSARANTSVRITPTLDAQLFYMYRAPMDVEQGRIGRMEMMSFALRKKLFGDKGNISLQIVDPFDRMEFSYRMHDARQEQTLRRKFGVRGAYLSFGYSFGRPPKIEQREAPQAPPQTPGMGIP